MEAYMDRSATRKLSTFLHLCVALLLIVPAVAARLAAQPACDAQFSHYPKASHTDSVHFYPRSSTVYKSYTWDFGDGQTSHDRYPWHHYASYGTYLVCLTVTDTSATGTCIETGCDSVVVAAPGPPTCNAQFAHYHASHADSVHFYPQSTATYKRYHWSFGDGTGSTVKDPWHVYAATGTYYACLTVYDTTTGGTCVDTWCDSVTVAGVTPPTCVAHFAHYPASAHPDSIHFYPYSGKVYKRYTWDFGDGQTSHERYPWHQYAAAGTYYACLTVTDTTAGGVCADTWCDSVLVAAPAPPVCDARFDHYSVANPDSVHFYPLANAPHAHYHWSFGDGTGSTNHDPWHLYPGAGTYIVCLTVTDTTSAGTCIDQQCDTLIIPVHVTVYPNPVRDMISIAVPHGMRPAHIAISDDKGRLVYSGESSAAGALTVSTRAMSSGMYVYTVTVDGAPLSSGKFVVVKSR
jgi:PKD repeat protein